jgi:hypothetical protein
MLLIICESWALYAVDYLWWLSAVYIADYLWGLSNEQPVEESVKNPHHNGTEKDGEYI